MGNDRETQDSRLWLLGFAVLALVTVGVCGGYYWGYYEGFTVGRDMEARWWSVKTVDQDKITIDWEDTDLWAGEAESYTGDVRCNQKKLIGSRQLCYYGPIEIYDGEQWQVLGTKGEWSEAEP